MSLEDNNTPLYRVNSGNQGAWFHREVEMAPMNGHLAVSPLTGHRASLLGMSLLPGGRFPGEDDTDIGPSIYRSSYSSQNLLVQRKVGLSATGPKESGAQLRYQQGNLSYTRRIHSLASCISQVNDYHRDVLEWMRYSPNQNTAYASEGNLQETIHSGYIEREVSIIPIQPSESLQSKTNEHNTVLGHLADRGDASRQDVYSHQQLHFVRDEYGFPVILGTGSFGEVRLASYGRKKMAVKYFTRQHSKIEDVVNEYEILKRLEGTGCVPKIASLIETDPDDPDFCGLALGMEAIDGITLDEYLWNHPDMSKLEWIDIAMQIVSAISKIHKKGILVNDIKTNNIMIAKKGNKQEVKIIDFGLATVGHGVAFKNTSTMSEFMHLAPEVRRGVESDQRSDVFSLGVVLDTILAFTEIEELRIPTEVCVQAEPAERIAASGARRLLQMIRDEVVIGECAQELENL
ncbi:hypothetical protein ScPMuIL_016940 [Solemya velum]